MHNVQSDAELAQAEAVVDGLGWRDWDLPQDGRTHYRAMLINDTVGWVAFFDGHAYFSFNRRDKRRRLEVQIAEAQARMDEQLRDLNSHVD